MNIRAIIVEDEENSRITLANMLLNFCEGVEVIAQVDSVKTALAAIRQHQPDLVFLDIEMPEDNGFKLFDYLPSIDFETIFTTAYNQYAVKAFRVSAIDYLLKPIDLNDLRKAILKVKDKKEEQIGSVQSRVDILRENLGGHMNKLALPTQDGFLFIDLKDLFYCEAQGNYTAFHLKTDGKILISKTLKIYADLLEEFGFFRINRSHLINLRHVRKYGRQKNPIITLSTGVPLTLSENRKEAFLEKIAMI